jgi:hypothetical protein
MVFGFKFSSHILLQKNWERWGDPFQAYLATFQVPEATAAADAAVEVVPSLAR